MRCGEAPWRSTQHARRPGWRATGGMQRASPRNSRLAAWPRTAPDTGAADHQNAPVRSQRAVAKRVDPADDRSGRGDGVVYVRVAEVGRSPVGDERLGSLQDMLWFGGDHECWRLIAQVGIHATEPRADRLGRVVLEKQADDLVSVPQAPLSVRMRDTKSARPLTNRLGVVDAGHNGGQALAEHFLKARGDLRYRSAHRASVGSLPNDSHGRHLCRSQYYPKPHLKSTLRARAAPGSPRLSRATLQLTQ